MLIVMKPDATTNDIRRVTETIESLGFKAHPMPGANRTAIGLTGNQGTVPTDPFADLPGGHSEGYDDAHKQLYKRFYAKVADRNAPIDYPTFEDGLWGMHLLAKVLESHEKQSWVQA